MCVSQRVGKSCGKSFSRSRYDERETRTHAPTLPFRPPCCRTPTLLYCVFSSNLSHTGNLYNLLPVQVQNQIFIRLQRCRGSRISALNTFLWNSLKLLVGPSGRPAVGISARQLFVLGRYKNLVLYLYCSSQRFQNAFLSRFTSRVAKYTGFLHVLRIIRIMYCIIRIICIIVRVLF